MVLQASKKLVITPDYKFQPQVWTPLQENPDHENKLSMLRQ